MSGSNNKVADVAATSVTTTNINQGAILAYVRDQFGSNNGPFQLPYTQYVFSGSGTFGYVPANGRMFYTFFLHDNSNSATPCCREYRYVVIPGAVSGGRLVSGPAAGYTISQIKGMSYSQIASMFNIPANGTNER
ncbi:MAG: hypothetical protein ACK5DG_13920 [Chitinophagaceae bacterium]